MSCFLLIIVWDLLSLCLWSDDMVWLLAASKYLRAVFCMLYVKILQAVFCLYRNIFIYTIIVMICAILSSHSELVNNNPIWIVVQHELESNMDKPNHSLRNLPVGFWVCSTQPCNVFWSVDEGFKWYLNDFLDLWRVNIIVLIYGHIFRQHIYKA